MNIVILTQREPFYFARNLRYLFTNIPKNIKVTGCVLFSVSPFGAKGSFLQKAKRTFDTFGLKFFYRYTLKYLKNRFDKKSDVKTVLNEFNIPFIEQNEDINSKESIRRIEGYGADLLVSIGGNQVFKKALIELAPKGCLNLHTALLPKYRGLMPCFWVLCNNEKETGASVFFVDEGIDSGPIIVQKKVQIGEKSLEELIIFTKKLGMDAIIEAIKLIEHGNYSLIQNDNSLQTYYSFPKRLDVKQFLRNGKRFY